MAHQQGNLQDDATIVLMRWSMPLDMSATGLRDHAGQLLVPPVPAQLADLSFATPIFC